MDAAKAIALLACQDIPRSGCLTGIMMKDTADGYGADNGRNGPEATQYSIITTTRGKQRRRYRPVYVSHTCLP